MKAHLQSLLVSLLFVSIIQTAYAQPANDDACNALALVLDGDIVAVDNTGATIQADEVSPPVTDIGDPCITAWCNQETEVQNSLWFSFIAPESGAVIINTCVDTNAIDTQIALWQTVDCSDFDSYTFIVANDDIPGDCNEGNQYSSNIFVDGLNAGETYYLQIDGYDGEEGVVGLEILTSLPLSKVNFIHNSADAAANVVDIRINGELYADDFEYQTCTGYIDVPADILSYITINPSTSDDDSTPLASLNYTLNSSQDYVMTVVGITSETGYMPMQPLTLAVYEGAQLYSSAAGTVNVLFQHGITDAPTIDLVNGETSEALVNDLAYGAYSANGYIVNNGETFSLMVTDEDGNDLGFNYCVPLNGIADLDLAFTVVLSGFVIPANNSDGQPAGVFFVNQFDGTFVELTSGMCAFPDNDNICEATTLIVNDPPTLADNSLASVEENESSTNNLAGNDPESDCINAWCDGALENTLWFTFTAPASGGITVNTCFATTIDTQVSVCEVGSCSDFSTVTYLGANDDMDGGCEGGNEFASELTVTGLTAGNTYYIQTDGWEGEIGEFEIQVTEFIVGVENTSADQVEFFPNPARDIISIRGAQGYSRVEIRDLQGKILTSENLNATRTVSLDGLSSGIYTITLIDQTQTRTGKLIIE
jgi:hypothetical protein